jgi:pyridoxamine 5'-phosphate oxidase-like protein
MIKLTQQMFELIGRAPNDGLHCLLVTAAPNCWPQTTLKGSLRVLDDQHLCYWERSLRSSFENLHTNPRVTVYYRNNELKDELPKGAGWRFYGLASVHQSGAERDRILAIMPRNEMDKDPDLKGAAILIKIVRVADIIGNTLQEDDA